MAQPPLCDPPHSYNGSSGVDGRGRGNDIIQWMNIRWFRAVALVQALLVALPLLAQATGATIRVTGPPKRIRLFDGAGNSVRRVFVPSGQNVVVENRTGSPLTVTIRVRGTQTARRTVQPGQITTFIMGDEELPPGFEYQIKDPPDEITIDGAAASTRPGGSELVLVDDGGPAVSPAILIGLAVVVFALIVALAARRRRTAPPPTP